MHKRTRRPLPPTNSGALSRLSPPICLRKQNSFQFERRERFADRTNLVGVVPLWIVFHIKHQSVRDQEFQARFVTSDSAMGLTRSRRYRRSRRNASRSGSPTGAQFRLRYRQILSRKIIENQQVMSGTWVSRNGAGVKSVEQSDPSLGLGS